MVQEEKIASFYYAQYRENAIHKGKNRGRNGNKSGRLDICRKQCTMLGRELNGLTHTHVKAARLEDFHRQIKNIAAVAFHKNDPVLMMKLRDQLIPTLVKAELCNMSSDRKELVTEKFLGFLRAEKPFWICTHSLDSLCADYSKFEIKEEIMGLVPERPEMEFPEALQKKRHFILHAGPTNCGKTYHALECLKQAEKGIYLGPLRLLALEVYEKMSELLPCSMVTGEESIVQPESRVISATVEMLDTSQEYDIAVIDEAQMIADPERGHSWTRAILGIRADEIHICMSEDAIPVITHLISLCHDTYEIERYHRKTELVCEEEPFSFPEDVRHGDALIVFTKKAVLDIAGRLEKEGMSVSVIYGSLPPQIRRKQVHLFTEKETGVIVSTDAIGMGLNLPVRRIVFMQTDKFDGKETRPLKPAEVKQIAGRAGRYGLYDRGYVTACSPDGLDFIRGQIGTANTELTKVTLGFPHILLDMDEPMNAILQIWKSVQPEPPFEKIDITSILFLYEKAYNVKKEIDGFENKHILFRMLTCSVDIKNKDIIDLWEYYCKTYTADRFLTFPSLQMCSGMGLVKYETYYKMLDLYHQFSVRLGKNMDLPRLEKERENVQNIIMAYLSEDKKEYIRTCKECGKILPIGYRYRICQPCYFLHNRF